MKTQNRPKKTFENSDPRDEIISLASKITELDNGFKWELTKWIGIIENQMDIMETTKDPDMIAYQTLMVIDIVKKMLDSAEEAFDSVDSIRIILAKMEPLSSGQ